MKDYKNVTIFDHPLIRHKIAILRDENTSMKEFRELVEEITTLMTFECLREDVPTVEKEVKTPLEVCTQQVVKDNAIVIVPILRAGLGMVNGVHVLFPSARVGHIGLYRDEETLEPVWYYDKRKEIKENKDKVFVIVLDPMLATGNSAVDAVENFISKGVKEENIIFVNLISSPEGIKRLSTACPKVQIISAALDEKLNSKGYILPGLGDAGDRIYNTPD